jgi:hypothetical protein
VNKTTINELTGKICKKQHDLVGGFSPSEKYENQLG